MITLAKAFLGLAPWYVWAGLLVVLVVLAYFGILPALAAVVRAFFTKIVVPFIEKYPVPSAIAALLLLGALWFRAWIVQHDVEVAAVATAAADQRSKAREDEANRRYSDTLAAMNRKLEHANENAQAAATAHAAELAARDAQRKAELAQREKERSENVTQKAIAACGDLHHGVIVQFNTGAARANGTAAAEDPAAAAARIAAADEPSGITLDRYAAAVDATQSALGTCRDQVKGWQTYYTSVLQPWITETLGAVQSFIPKEVPP